MMGTERIRVGDTIPSITWVSIRYSIGVGPLHAPLLFVK